jgi:hypothetical protein
LQAEFGLMERIGFAHLYPARWRSVVAPGHNGYPRTPDLNSRLGPEGQMGHLIAGAPAEPVSPLPHFTRKHRCRNAGWHRQQ